MARLPCPRRLPLGSKADPRVAEAPPLIEETYEALDTIDRRDFAKLKEELGDVLLQVLFHSQIGTEAGTFTIDDVLEQLGDKLVRRHPHVFGESADGTPAESQFRPGRSSLGRHQTGRAQECRKAGFGPARHSQSPARCCGPTRPRFVPHGWDSTGPESPQGLAAVLDKVDEELGELRHAITTRRHRRRPPPRPRWNRQRQWPPNWETCCSPGERGASPQSESEESLRLATNASPAAFSLLSRRRRERSRNVNDLTLAEMDAFWNAAKRRNHRSRTRQAPRRLLQRTRLTADLPMTTENNP